MADVVALPVAELNRLVQLGHRRAVQLEPRLAGLLEPIFVQYGDEAAERFVSQTETLAAGGSRELSRGLSDAPAASSDPFMAELAAALREPVTDLSPTDRTTFTVPLAAVVAAADWNPPMADELVDVDRLVADLRTKTDPVRLAAIEAMMGPVLEGSGLSFDPHNPHAARVLQQSGSQVTHVAATTRENVRRIITASYKEGLSIPDTAKAIRRGMRAASSARATLIARTELVGAVNGGSLAAVNIVDEHTSVRHVKVWLTGPGARYPRHELYVGLDGQTVGMDEYFIVGFDELLYPGDPDGSPEEVCNCRCAISYEEEAGEPRKDDAPAPAEGAPAAPAAPADVGPPLTDGPATAALDAVAGSWGSSLTPEELDALYAYRETKGFAAINKYLREGGPDLTLRVADDIPGMNVSEAVARIDAVVARAPETPNDMDMLVFRGIRDKNALFDGAPTVGDIFVDPAYTSTTTEFKIASQRYTKEIGAPVSAPNPNAAVLEIEVPKGTRGAWMRANEALEDQGNREFVLDRNTRFRIVKVSEREKYEGDPDEMITVVRVQVVPRPSEVEAVAKADRGVGWAPNETRFSVDPPEPEGWRAWRDSLNGDQLDAVYRYTSEGAFKELNAAMRGETPMTGELVELRDRLTEAVRSAPRFDGEVTVWRGVDLGPGGDLGAEAVGLSREAREALQFERVADLAENQFKPGKTVTFDSFQSTTTYTDPALDAALAPKHPGVIFEIRTSEGALIKSPLTKYDDEAEILLAPGTRFRVEGVLREANFEKGDYGDTVRRTVVQLRALPSPRPPEPLAPPRSLGTRPWIHYKDSTLVTQIGRQRKALKAAENAGDTAAAQALRTRVEELLEEQGIRRGRLAERRPWEHYKDSTLTTQIGRQRKALEAATTDAERSRLENRVAELLREKEIRRGGAGNVGTVVVTKPEVVKAAVRESERAARRTVAEPETRTFDPNTPAPQAELLRAAGHGLLRDDVLYRTEDGPVKFTSMGSHQAGPGWVAVVENMPVFIEESPSWDATAVMGRLREQLSTLRRGSPEMYHTVMENTSRINVWAGRNPADEFWAKEYNTPGFESAATGGGGSVDYWDVGVRELVRGDNADILYHELGHEVGISAGPHDTIGWHAAMRADRAHGAALNADRTYGGGEHYRFSFRVGGDSVSSYGTNSIKEDWAESFRLYLQEKTGYAPAGTFGYFRPDPYRVSTHRAATFSDLWPARARAIEDFLANGY